MGEPRRGGATPRPGERGLGLPQGSGARCKLSFGRRYSPRGRRWKMIDSPEDPLHCSNGPLPASFRVRAYFTANCDEFALGPGDALEYLSWCDQEGLTVLGFDTWEPSQPGPTVVNG